MNARLLFTNFLKEKLPTIDISANHIESRVLNGLPTPKEYQAELDGIANLFTNCGTPDDLKTLSTTLAEQLGAFLNKYFLPLLSDNTQTVHSEVAAILEQHKIPTPTAKQFLAAFMNEIVASHVVVTVGKNTNNLAICNDYLSRAAEAFTEPTYAPHSALPNAFYLSDNDYRQLIKKNDKFYRGKIEGFENELKMLLRKNSPEHTKIIDTIRLLYDEERLYLKHNPARLNKLKQDYANALDACITFMKNPNETNAEQTLREATHTFTNSKQLRMRLLGGYLLTLAAIAIAVAAIVIPILIAVATQGLAVPFFATAILAAGPAAFISSMIAIPAVGTALSTLGFWAGYPKLSVGSRSLNTANRIDKEIESIITTRLPPTRA